MEHRPPSPSRPESEPEKSTKDVKRDRQEKQEQEDVKEEAEEEARPPVDPEEPPLPDEAAPPLPDEAPPSADVDDGWQPIWDENAQAFYFYNRFSQVTQWENPRVPSANANANANANQTAAVATSNHDTEANSPSSAAALVAPVSRYNPAIHGDYDPNADYAKPQQPASGAADGTSLTDLVTTDVAEAYMATGAFNRFTGRWQEEDLTPDKFSDESKSKRQMHAFFDVDAAANSHDGRSLRAERQQKKLSKKELKAFKEKRRERKEEKRRAWLKD